MIPPCRPGPVLVVAGLSKSYGGRVVLDIEELTLQRGEVFVVLGPSGAGKTTLLRLLAALEQPDAGEVRLDGLVRKAGHAGGAGRPGPDVVWRRRLAFVAQHPVLFSDTVLENVTLGLRLRGVAPGAARDRALAVLAELGLGDLAACPASGLSAGEAQRVALARALVTDPVVLLLDEPTANLDPANAAAVERAVRRAVESRGLAALIVTHDLFQARRLADRAALLVQGRIVETGEARRLFERPRDPRTAAFVRGEMIL
ncbi:MAG: ATP-binding cassette domain-containing protein [Firmicutes bacterium]|nr:ATP-binding cassette domain-containing protein [Bacillota bacterium]